MCVFVHSVVVRSEYTNNGTFLMNRKKTRLFNIIDRPVSSYEYLCTDELIELLLFYLLIFFFFIKFILALRHALK